MKQSTSMIITLVVLFLSFSSSASNVESCFLKVRATNIPPLYFQNHSGQWTGLTVDLAKVLLKEAGCKGKFEAISWARSISLMKNGGIDMMMNLSKTKDREQFIHFIGPHNIETAQLITKKKVSTDIKSLEDFKKIPGQIGYQQGSFYGDEFLGKLKNDPEFRSKFEVASSQEFNIKKLKANRIVGLLGPNYNGVSAKRHLIGNDNYKIHPFVVNQNKVYFGFSKKSVSPEILNLLDKAYARAIIKKDFDRVIDNYK